MAQNSPAKKATTMADLMAASKTDFKSVNKGELLSGTITKLTSGEILVDIGAKTEAVVLEKDKNILHSLLSSLKVGDKVEVSVLNPESDEGFPVVSLRRFIDEKVWQKVDILLKNKEILEVNIDEMTRGGYVVSTDNGIAGFLPNSHLMVSDSSNLVGKRIKASVLEVNRELRKVIFSQKSTVTVKDFEDAAKEMKEGTTVSSAVINVAPFGVFVTLTSSTDIPLEGFIHQSEVSWEKTEDLPSKFKPGEKIEAKVIGLDSANKRVNLSIKRLTSDPFEEVMKEFVPEKKINATISKVSSQGIILDLGNGVEGIIKKEKVPPNSTYAAGQKISATIVDVDTNRHRVILVPVLLEKPMGYR